jgi:hypothetical protein
MGHPDFRIRGKIFATLGYPDDGWGMVKLTPEEQELFVQMEPAIFHLAKGAWGRRGGTIVRLRAAQQATLHNALMAAWRNTAPKSLVLQVDSAAPNRAGPKARIKAARRFPDDILAAIREGKSLGIRAGTKPHRFIRIWAVVVEGGVFVRSWSIKPRSWYRTFLKEPRGAVQVAGRELPVRAVRTRNTHLKDAVDRAYLEKYNSPGAIQYARDLGLPKSRATTTELVPL